MKKHVNFLNLDFGYGTTIIQQLLKNIDYRNIEGYYVISCSIQHLFPSIFFEIGENFFEVPPSSYIINVTIKHLFSILQIVN